MTGLSSIKLPCFYRPKAINAAKRALASAAFSACLFGGSGTSGFADAGASSAWRDSFQSRLEILALIETLNANLLASRSATQTLIDWCAAHHMAEPAKIVAHRDHAAAKPISAEQRRDLAIGPDEPVIYRRVDLACGDHVLSRADNWYVPSRLTPAMNAALTTTETPFGLVVRPLHPRRETLDVETFWRPLPQGWEMSAAASENAAQNLALPPLLFAHRAIVYDAGNRPIAEVQENYTSAILDFRHIQ